MRHLACSDVLTNCNMLILSSENDVIKVILGSRLGNLHAFIDLLCPKLGMQRNRWLRCFLL